MSISRKQFLQALNQPAHDLVAALNKGDADLIEQAQVELGYHVRKVRVNYPTLLAEYADANDAARLAASIAHTDLSEGDGEAQEALMKQSLDELMDITDVD